MADWNGPAIWPPPPSEDVLTSPRLTADGNHIEGWVRRPTDGVWKPHDLLWLPPSATKSTDIDGIGQVVDMQDFDGIGHHDWVVAQLNKREKYLDYIRAKVRAGAYRLTAQLAKMLGMDLPEDGAELVPRTGPVAYQAMAAKQLVAEGRRLVGSLPIDRDTGLPIVTWRKDH